MNSYIRKIINEQFNISNMDFNDKKSKQNIFNKSPMYGYDFYNKILNREHIDDIEIKYMNEQVSVVIPNNEDELRFIVKYYSKHHSAQSLNWLNVSHITNMDNLFDSTIYSGDISKWDVSGVTSMNGMFNWTSFFECDISGWDVSNVTSMSAMFSLSRFNGNISLWDVSNVTDMSYMFSGSIFNGDISMWDVSSVTDMRCMFYNSYFNHDISKWDVDNVEYYNNIFDKCSILEEYKPEKFRNI